MPYTLFAGTNTLKVSDDTLRQIVEKALNTEFKSEVIRVTAVSQTYAGVDIVFTSDPDPVAAAIDRTLQRFDAAPAHIPDANFIG